MTTPMYRDIAAQLRQRIDSGEFASGSRLPTEQDLQAAVRRVPQHDQGRHQAAHHPRTGRDQARPGHLRGPQGRPVRDHPDRRSEDGRRLHLQGPRRRPGRRPPARSRSRSRRRRGTSAGLWVAPGTEVVSRHRKRFIDGDPWALETSFYPGEFADRGADRLRKARDIEDGTVRYLKEAIGIRQVGYRDWVTVRSPNGNEAEFFKLPRMAGSRCTRCSGPRSTGTGSRYGSP